jgi:hypothetical protein
MSKHSPDLGDGNTQQGVDESPRPARSVDETRPPVEQRSDALTSFIESICRFVAG